MGFSTMKEMARIFIPLSAAGISGVGVGSWHSASGAPKPHRAINRILGTFMGWAKRSHLLGRKPAEGCDIEAAAEVLVRFLLQLFRLQFRVIHWIEVFRHALHDRLAPGLRQ